MKQHIAHIALLVKDYDMAIQYYTQVMGFSLLEDVDLGEHKRWVRVAPKGTTGTALLLAKANDTNQEKQIGNQGGGRVFLFLYTDDFWRDFETMRSKGVLFREQPRKEPYGTVAVFEDLYGNLWDLLEPAT